MKSDLFLSFKLIMPIDNILFKCDEHNVFYCKGYQWFQPKNWNTNEQKLIKILIDHMNKNTKGDIQFTIEEIVDIFHDPEHYDEDNREYAIRIVLKDKKGICMPMFNMNECDEGYMIELAYV